MSSPQTLTNREQAEIDAANRSGRPTVVFVHGLWLLSNSWDRWRSVFESAGYATIAPGWPDDPDTVEEGRRNPSRFAGKGVGSITDHFAHAIGALDHKPAIIGHSFGGLITQKLAGMGLAAASVPIDAAPFRGVIPLPASALKAASPVLLKPSNRSLAVMLTYAQFRYAFANAVSESEAHQLYEEFPVPGAGRPLFQAAFANLSPKSEASVDSRDPNRGPMKMLSGANDHTVPWAIAHASFQRQVRNIGVTEIEKIPDRGHSLVIDSGWQEVAEKALAFVRRYLAP